MLTESFVVSTLNPEKPSNSVTSGVHLYDFQPLPGLRSTFKKSSTNTNSLAISPSHVFAAQADKAVIHVYSRERNNLEAVVPFPERIHSIVLAGESDGAGMLILGTEGGRLILWEVCLSCRQNIFLLVTLTSRSSLELADKYLHHNITSSQQHALRWIQPPTSSCPAPQIRRSMSGLSRVCSHSQPHQPMRMAMICRSLLSGHCRTIALQ